MFIYPNFRKGEQKLIGKQQNWRFLTFHSVNTLSLKYSVCTHQLKRNAFVHIWLYPRLRVLNSYSYKNKEVIMEESVGKVVTLIGSSRESFEKAIANAVQRRQRRQCMAYMLPMYGSCTCTLKTARLLAIGRGSGWPSNTIQNIRSSYNPVNCQ